MSCLIDRFYPVMENGVEIQQWKMLSIWPNFTSIKSWGWVATWNQWTTTTDDIFLKKFTTLAVKESKRLPSVRHPFFTIWEFWPDKLIWVFHFLKIYLKFRFLERLKEEDSFDSEDDRRWGRQNVNHSLSLSRLL